MANRTILNGFNPSKVPSKSGAYIAGEGIDRDTPSPKMVESASDLRTKRSGTGNKGFNAKTSK